MKFIRGLGLAGALCVCDFVEADVVFLEKGGVLVMEVESTESSLGKWKKKTEVEGFTGESHLEFTGNKITNGPPVSPLRYQFKIEKGGVYTLILRAHKRLETEREDLSNDCFVSLKGDFEAAGGTPKKLLEKETKMFGGTAEGWGWARKLDDGHKKFDPKYQLKGGEEYTLTLHGRSKNFNLDRIILVHESENLKALMNKLPSESARSGGVKSGAKVKVLEERVLTNEEGKKIKARLVSKKDNTLVVMVNDRRYELKIDELSEDDQKFLKEWSP